MRKPLIEVLSSIVKISDIISLIASLIGIFGFLTGISSLPLLITSGNEGVNTHRQAVWFGDSIPLSISIPVFFITLLFIYGLYFLMLIRINRWLYRIHAISPPKSGWKGRRVVDNDLGDMFSVTFFVVLGIAIGVLVARAFFDFSVQPGVDGGFVLLCLSAGMILFLFFLYSLCAAAREAGAQLESKLGHSQ
jgi:hypothetical protein